jgi:dimethylargininase
MRSRCENNIRCRTHGCYVVACTRKVALAAGAQTLRQPCVTHDGSLIAIIGTSSRSIRVRLTQAIVRIPATNFAAGISSCAGGGSPDFTLALTQHEHYCEALSDCGLELTKLAPDPQHPDSTFVEDAAVLTSRAAIVTRPGAPSRLAEATAMLEPLRGFFSTVREIQPPGTVDGGDVCEADGDFVIGLSARTNEEGARQLGAFLSDFGHKSTLVDIRACKALLHLKTGLSYLGDGVFVVAAQTQLRDALDRYELITVSRAEAYAANCIRVNARILIAAGYPKVLAALTARGYQVITLEMSEFKKMDGGLSCLSLRF